MKKIIYLCLCLFVVACGSSNDIATLPDIEVDDQVPTIVDQGPLIADGEVVDIDFEYVAKFSELLDEQSLSEGVKMVTLKGREIFANATFSGSVSVNASPAVDLRPVNLQISEYVRTTDEEPGFQAPREVLATEVRVVPDGGLALATDYAIGFTRSIKDRSPIASVSPDSGFSTTGNFLEGDLVTSFRTKDGAWSSSSAVVSGTSTGSLVRRLGSPAAAELVENSLVFWLQNKEENGREISALQFDTVDQESLSLAGNITRVDYVTGIDTVTSQIDNDVVVYSATEIENSACVAWLSRTANTSPSQFSLLSRCIGSDGVSGARYPIFVDQSGDVADLKVQQISNNLILVSYLESGQLKGATLRVDRDLSMALEGSFTLGNVAERVTEYVFSDSAAAVDQSGLNFLTSEEVIGGAGNRFSIKHWRIDETIGRPELVALVDSGLSQYSELSFGLDSLGRGFAGWVSGIALESSFATSRYDGQNWEQAIRVFKDGRGGIDYGKVFVFSDGAAVFYWLQPIDNTVRLRAQGYFQNGGLAEFVRPSWIEVASFGLGVGHVQFLGDREGNGMLFYKVGASLTAIRFLHNRAWTDAWNTVSLPGVQSSLNTTIFPSQIGSKGKMMLLSVDSDSQLDDLLNANFFAD